MRVDILKNKYGWFVKYQEGQLTGPYSTIVLAINSIDGAIKSERYISAEPGYVLTVEDKQEILAVLDFYNSTLKAKSANQIKDIPSLPEDVNFDVMAHINKNIASTVQQHVDESIKTELLGAGGPSTHNEEKTYKCKVMYYNGAYCGYINGRLESTGYYFKISCIMALKRAVRRMRRCERKNDIDFEL